MPNIFCISLVSLTGCLIAQQSNRFTLMSDSIQQSIHLIFAVNRGLFLLKKRE